MACICSVPQYFKPHNSLQTYSNRFHEHQYRRLRRSSYVQPCSPHRTCSRLRFWHCRIFHAEVPVPVRTNAKRCFYTVHCPLLVGALTIFFDRRQSDSRSPPPSKPSRAVSPVFSSPPPVRAAAAAAFKALSTKDIIKNVITPPMSPSSPGAMSPAAAVMLSPRLRKLASHAMPPPSHPPLSSPRSGKKSTPLKAKSSVLGVFKADFIVAEKKDKGVVSYLIRLLACDAPS